ncbi:MAG: acetylglutamate kinase [Deferribacterota bacterium]|nr:acetylglutamate kinase [Deferribacterota bacterium]
MNIENEIKKANILIEALPYIRRFYGKTIVIKYGGSAMVDENLRANFAKDIVLLKFIGINIIIVHGGGPQINTLLKRVGVKSKFVNGLRITDNETMELVEMVLSGNVNKDIVNLINKMGGKAIGLSGKDGPIIRVEKKKMYSDNKFVDLGQVGIITAINSELIKQVESSYIPVIAPIGVDEEFVTYNINADMVAGYLAASLNAEKLIVLTDVEGLLDKSGKLVSTITLDKLESLNSEGYINGGMIPKLEAVIHAVRSGVNKVHIINGTIIHSLLLELFTDKGIGTQIVR